MITFAELKQAAKVFNHINELRNYVSRERFDRMAKVLFGIDNSHKLNVMYGLFQDIPREIHYISICESHALDSDTREMFKLLPQALEIAEAVFAQRRSAIPYVEHEDYRHYDMRRYFYTQDGKAKMLDVNLSAAADICLLAELVKRDDCTLKGVAEHLGYLEGAIKGYEKEKFQYFEGDVYFLFGKPTDNIFFSYTRDDDSGVYVASPEGWRKLFYTPTRGYITRNGRLDFDDEKKFYSDYMLEAAGKGFLYIGNIHDNLSVLKEQAKK